MAWYEGVFACGHEGSVNVIGKGKDRPWKIRHAFSKLCEDCYNAELEKKKERELQEAAAIEKEHDLPKLKGSDKQIQWAMILRKKLIDQYQELPFDKSKENETVTIDKIENAFKYIVNQSKASFFIDNRHLGIVQLLQNVYEIANDNDKISKKLEKEIHAENTVYPVERITDASAEIVIEGNKVKARFERRNEFIKNVKDLKYRWDGEAWTKELTETTGKAADRVAELGNKLLIAGIPVTIYDEQTLNSAVNGGFEPECYRWIKKLGDKLIITWDGYNDELYKQSKSLPSAKWDGGMTVNVAHHVEVEDFANAYDFKFTAAALKLIDKHKQMLKQIDPVKVALIEEPENNYLESILESSDDILDDLKD